MILPDLAGSQLHGPFWGRWAAVHRGAALDHQWDLLGQTGAIECFEAVAGTPDAFVWRDFTSDSDVYKWADAAARTLATDPRPEVAARLDELIALVAAAQDADGYVNTWIQAFFPRGRFRNLETEHETYTLGHLIEAGVSHHEATGDDRLLLLVRRAADLLVRELADAPARRLVGHEGIEIALVRLHRATGEPAYLDLARHLVEHRGGASGVRSRFVATAARTGARLLRQARERRAHRRRHPSAAVPRRSAAISVRVTPSVVAATVAEFVSGRWAQTDRPVRDLLVPTGHAVCFQYLQTAVAMVARETGDEALRAVTVTAWDRLVQEHLFVSGGAGAHPGLEGFGAPYDLDPERAYAETCASLAGTFWNRELGLLTGEAHHDDLLEWQLLNGVGVGMGVAGTEYAYNNPLQAPPGFDRRPWFPIPCCPSNLSRTWASLPTLALSRSGPDLRLHQFFSTAVRIGDLDVEVDSALPWSGDVVVWLAATDQGPERLVFRVPSWAGDVRVLVDGHPVAPDVDPLPAPRATASGLDPWRARWARVALPAGAGCEVALAFDLPVRRLRQDDRVPKVGGKVALARGPLLYCLEAVDHPDLGWPALTDVALGPEPIEPRFDPDLLGGATVLHARAAGGQALRFVPYHLWGNRGATGMTPFVS